MANKNMELWNKVFTTDVKYTKPARKGAYEFTSIAPMYQKMRMTEACGPQGIFWGVEVDSEVFEHKEIGTTILLIYRAVMFFEYDDKKGRIPIAATEKLAYQTQGANGYLKIDDEADKKVRTAALTKGLSEIGVTADIHMGLHENYEYQEYASAKLRVDSGDDEQVRAANDDFKNWFNEQVEAIELLPNENAVELVVNRIEASMNDRLIILKASPQKREAMRARLHGAADKKVQKLRGVKNG